MNYGMLDSGELMSINYGGHGANFNHHHREHRARVSPKRRIVRQISQGQYREVLAKLTESESEILTFKWGLTDGHPCSSSVAAERFSVPQELVEQLELKALQLISEL